MKEIKALLIAVNSTENLFKYPIGNIELTVKLKLYETSGHIKFNPINNKWEKTKK